MSGIVISNVITLCISLAVVSGNYYPCVPSLIERFDSKLTAVIIQTGLSAVLGAGFAGCSVIWQKEEWSLLKQTSIYFSITSPLMVTVAYICEWMEPSVKGAIIYFVIFFLIFVMVWISEYLIWKARISKINTGICENNK